MKLLLIAAAVLLILDYLGLGKGKFRNVSGVLALVAIFLLLLHILGALLDFVLKIILLLLGIYIILRLVNAIKDTLKK
ncbi:MAG: hypothetical protein IJO29_03035 [Oscillospiraceae bacterium]|nr:hypothetical protein [Oscillospiraceae bacterium]